MLGRVDSVCPSCGAELAKRPASKRKCPECGSNIFVRHRPQDDEWVLLSPDELPQFEAQRATFHASKASAPRPPRADDVRADPIYWTAYNARMLRQIEDAEGAGIRMTLMLLTSNDGGCEVAETLAGQCFGHNELQALPLPGCSRAPHCSCVYIPHLPDEKPWTPERGAEVDAEYERVLAALPRPAQDKMRSILDDALRAFGLPPKKRP